ncbi:MAG: hypothetical protein NVSMB17_08010 [Candidatus Dormibacteria bacterium]
MLSRFAHARPLRGVLGDILNQVSLLMVVSLSLALILVTGSHLSRHFGLVRGNPLVAIVPARDAPHDPTRGLDLQTKKESGLVTPSTAPPVAPVPPPSTVLGHPEQTLVSPVLPGTADMGRPLHGGTWLPIVMYHYVRDVTPQDKVGWTLSTSPREFRRQVAWLSEHGYTPVTMRDVDLILSGQKKGPERPVALTFDDGYRDFYTNAAPILRSAGFTATNYVPTQLVGGSNYMTWKEVQDLDAEGFEMAAHSQAHVDVSKTNPERARVEIFGAKADLESHLGHPVVDFAYPYGGFNLPIMAMLKEAGYWSATTTQPGAWHDANHLLYLSRVRVGGAADLSSLIAGITAPG